MQIDLILDTNILIYLLQKEEKYTAFLEKIGEKRLGISVVSYMELIVGVDSENDAKVITEFLANVEIIPVNKNIAEQTAAVLRKRTKRGLKDPQLADTIIAQTALILGVPLVTNNAKDFSIFRGLKLIVP